MHYHLEIIMPPTDDVEGAVKEIMSPFDENRSDEDEDGSDKQHVFWDWWQIGGRYSARKLRAEIGAAQLDAFHALMTERKVTVSGFQAGKPALEPVSQIPMVDQLWNETFPDSPIKQCPLFDHYKGTVGDVSLVSETPPGLTCAHLIVAVRSPFNGDKLKAEVMLETSVWNGVNYIDTTWDGTVRAAIEFHEKHIDRYKPEVQEIYSIKPDWLCVTVDYHS